MTPARFPVLILAAALAAAPLLSGDKKRKSAEKEKIEDLNELSSRLNKLASKPRVTEQQRFLHSRISALLERGREAPADSYLFDRLDSAIDDLLDASREIEKVRDPDEDEDEEDREEGAQRRTARELEKTYLRVRQGDYFGKQTGDPDAGDYLKLARVLYQEGRLAYDSGKYWRARRFADAAREVIDGLENLAQAAVQIPELPKL